MGMHLTPRRRNRANVVLISDDELPLILLSLMLSSAPPLEQEPNHITVSPVLLASLRNLTLVATTFVNGSQSWLAFLRNISTTLTTLCPPKTLENLGKFFLFASPRPEITRDNEAFALRLTYSLVLTGYIATPSPSWSTRKWSRKSLRKSSSAPLAKYNRSLANKNLVFLKLSSLPYHVLHFVTSVPFFSQFCSPFAFQFINPIKL